MAGLDTAPAEEAGNSTSSGSTPSLEAEGGKTKGGSNSTTPRKINLNLKMSFRTLTAPPRRQPRDKNEPSRFLGEGVSFKAKLIGILEVSEARGDRMCQEALADLKMAIRAAGEHKQRININIAIDGLRLRDEKNGDCLYHHPVHKISFIAQDMSDSRAFGYIFGSPDTGHRFFGIKTDKAASQVVIAMRDLFQVVFELKKKEIEMAKQHIEQHQIKMTGGIFPDSGSSLTKNGVTSSDQSAKTKSVSESSAKESESASGKPAGGQPSEVIADLLDLEFELNSIQQGIHQMERITPSDPFGPAATKDSPFPEDPFGDSFSPPVATIPPPPKSARPTIPVLLPPPKDPPRGGADPFNPPSRQPNRRGGVRGRGSSERSSKSSVPVGDPPPPGRPAPAQDKEKHWFDQETESIFGEGELVTPPMSSSAATAVFPSLTDKVVADLSKTPPPLAQPEAFDVFTDLDPLGTGRSKPYIDRKDFFQELKNPPKKVLKDLVSEAPSEATAPLFRATFDSGGASGAADADLAFPEPSRLESDPFEDVDPFFKSDPFDDDAFPPPPAANAGDPFDTEFADFTTFGSGGRKNAFPMPGEGLPSQEPDLERVSPLPTEAGRSNFHGPLRVSLPPERPGEGTADAHPGSGRPTPARPSGGPAKPRSKTRLQKQTTVCGLVKLPSPKSSQRSARLAKQATVDVCQGKPRTLHPSPTPGSPPNPRRSPHMETVTLRMRSNVTPSPPGVACFPDPSRPIAEPGDVAPEPPPRPASNVALIKPPPLPPKRQQPGYVQRPPPRPPHTDDPTHYDYIENYETSSSPTPRGPAEEVPSPPIPVPARRPRFGLDDLGSAPQRPRRHHPTALALSSKAAEEDYLTPIPFPLLPPPQKRSQDASKTPTPSPNTTSIATLLNTTVSVAGPQADDAQSKTQEPSTATSLNITLSQLTKTGFSDLATALGISPSQLSNMTLQDLTKCLAKLSAEEQIAAEPKEETKLEGIEPAKKDKRDKYATLRESVDEEPIFKADFETTFDDVEPTEKAPEDVFQETLFDKYAVFRELINEEKTEEQLEVKDSEADVVEEMSQAEFQVDSVESKVEAPVVTPPIATETEDRYAALRDITLDEREPEPDAEETEVVSDKEESLAEGAPVEEDYDLLTLSRQHSESTESPTMETATMREPQSIIETTIYEEDVSALEADNDDNFEDVPEIIEEEEEGVRESNDGDEGKEETEDAPASEALRHSSSSEKEEAKETPVETKAKEEETAESWAKFDSATFPPEKPPPTEGAGSEGGASPWSSDGKEFGKVQSPTWKESYSQERDTQRRRRVQQRSPWRDEESEEGWEGPWEERSWRENGWSEDGESYYEDAPPRKERVYHEDRRGRRRRVSPWKKGQKSSRDTSPWEQGRRNEDDDWGGGGKRYQDRSMDADDDDEYEGYWKSRPKHRGPSWEEERRRRFESRELNGLDFEEGRKRRPSPWGDGDRRSSRESVSWDEEERFSQREYGDRRPRERDGDYRRRREQDVDSRGYAWGRKGSEEEYGRRESRRKQESRRYYRDHSRESPWEDDYSEQGDEDSPQYQGKARSWSSKRPSGPSDSRRSIDKSPGEYKNRSVEKPQYSLPVSGRQDSGEKMGAAEKRYKEKCGMRPRSREEHFTSDQEYDYWPQTERGRRESGGYEKRSQTLHSRRSGKYKKGQERPSYAQKSPFDDDFSSHSPSFGADFKSQGGESDASDSVRKKSPINPSRLFTYTDAFPRRRDQPCSEIRPTDIVPSSPLESRDSPREETPRSRTSRGSCNRQSPFEDDFTPPETRTPSGRLASSISSDVSDQRRSPYRVPSVAEESDNAENANGRFGDDVFLPGDDADKRFADFENDAFPGNSGDFAPGRAVAPENRRPDRRVGWSGEEGKRGEKCVSLTKTRIGSLRTDPTNIKKSESVNIFRRENDPFDDDFFSGEVPNVSSQTRPRPDRLRATDKSNNNSDPFKWTKAFESFNFDEEQ